MNNNGDEMKMGWILGCIDEKRAYYGTLSDALAIPHEYWQPLDPEFKAPVPYCKWKRCTDRANDHKVMGNVHFKRGEYAKAIDEYSEGLLYDPVDASAIATLLSNRSECRVRQKDWLEALGDAERVEVEGERGPRPAQRDRDFRRFRTDGRKAKRRRRPRRRRRQDLAALLEPQPERTVLRSRGAHRGSSSFWTLAS